MKKIILHKVMSTILSVVLLFCMTLVVSAEEAPKTVDKNMQCLYESLRFKEKYTVVQIKASSQKAIIKYPDNYAGMYIDGNNVLHINYTNEVETLVGEHNLDTVKYEQVRYTYNQLQIVANVLAENMVELEVQCIGIDESENKISVYTESANYEKILQYLSERVIFFNPDFIKFEQAVNPKKNDAAGAAIKSGNTGRTFTLGYNVYKASTGKYGFVTCAHGVEGVGDTVKRNKFLGATLGTVENYKYSGKVDACFVPYKNQKNVTSETVFSDPVTKTFSVDTALEGFSVRKYGNTTGLTYGFISHANAFVTYDGKTISDQIQMRIEARGGDSGGPVTLRHTYAYVETDDALLLGICNVTDTNTYEVAWATKAVNINSEFGLTTYVLT